ncbi:MAG: plasmid pRiA4b ORF-3 family protein [Candidatus Methanoperedens sp.]|nr:plasmid pRiA4b ORF-3 family protein [Candidatus Methanoperedens sp.]MCE8424385.1 plasmid pRiA4b ORF-3 family protein [Candidatus Methanoperedens sp.]MCE8427285.1 plasmid pRiA4b ORF-3 family protein [Candidatus Methanoperedens sp.]
MTKKKRTKDICVYQMKVTLEGISPPIWRKIQVTSDTTLDRFHRILQIIMGWNDYHLHEFIIGGIHFGVPDEDGLMDVKNEENMGLSFSIEKTKFTYIYDFGDDWNHKILVEKILPLDPNTKYPRCIKGKRASPPEDCGGIGGYYEFIEAIQDPDNPEHDEMLEWVDEDFDPEAFDLDIINRELEKI